MLVAPFFIGFLFLLFILVTLVAQCIKVVNEWERLAILTLGKYSGLKGPGLIFLIPIIQTVANRIDMRTISSKFNSETTLTKDGVAVTVQAVLFWKVVSPEKATLQVADYRMAVELAAQTSLRDAIGKMSLASILSNLDELDVTIKDSITNKVGQWGIEAQAVEIRDVSIPQELQEVMSRSAQADREKLARITYGEAEIEAAKKFVEASEIYASTPGSLQLRAMSILTEAVKNDQNTLIITPSEIASALSPTALASAVASQVKIK